MLSASPAIPSFLARFGAAAAALMLVLPFLQPHHRYPLPAFFSEWLAFAFGLAAFSFFLSRSSWREFRLPPVAIAPLGLGLVFWLQVLLGRVTYVEQAQVATLYLSWSVLLIVLGGGLRRALGEEKLARLFAGALFFGGVLSALLAVLQHYNVAALAFLYMRKTGAVVYGNLAQSNHFATYTALALCSAVFLWSRGFVRWTVAAPPVALLLFVLALSGSRSAWLYLAVLSAFSTLACLRSPSRESRRLRAMSLALLPGLAVANGIAASPFMAPPAGELQTVLTRLFEQAQGASIRFELWDEALRMFMRAPLAGVGLAQFQSNHYELVAQTVNAVVRGPMDQAHSVFFQILAEAGTLGTVCVGAGLAAWWRGLRNFALTPERVWMYGLLGIIGIHALLEFPLWYAYFLGPASVLLGMSAADGSPRDLQRIGCVATLVLLIAGSQMLAVAAYNYRTFEKTFFGASAGAALSVLPADAERTLMGLYQDPVLVPYLELALVYGRRLDDDAGRDTLELHERARQFFPNRVTTYRLAAVLAAAGKPDAAAAELDKATSVFPDALPEFIEDLRPHAARRPERFGALLKSALLKQQALAVSGGGR